MTASREANAMDRVVFFLVSIALLAVATTAWASPAGTPLPNGVRAVWDLDKADRDKTPTRESVCLNGLWRWQPAAAVTEAVPADRWGYFKVPGPWPGITDYMQKDCQTLYPHPDWKDERLAGITAAWYQREIAVPAGWSGRRIALRAEYLNSFAVVYVDGKKAGELRFPSGELDLTSHCRPGGTHALSMLVLALPLKGVMLSYTDTASAREVRGAVERRGLCGDVSLVSTPPAARIADLKIDTSVRKAEITVDSALQDLAPEVLYTLHAQLHENGRTIREFTSPAFKAADLTGGRIAFTEKWKPVKLWDLHTPQNMYSVQVSLVSPGGKIVDTFQPIHFGFREFWIDGRDFFLNGTRIFLSAVPLDNAQVGAAWSTYEAARESLQRLKSFGINFVYTHNYGCQPGSHLSFTDILRAADDVGMLVALSQPHFSHYDWQAPDADRTNGYARHAEFYVHVAQNHPSVVAYAMSHNATGYGEDMNPAMIDGLRDPREPYAMNNERLALRAEAIVKRLDPGRIVYHHSSGNLGSMHTVNFYANFTPIQELSDWFEHWATVGVKPVFLCEYGVPFSWDWAMYRGWYKGQREFGSAVVPWEFCLAEWNAQFLGDQAYHVSDMEKADLRWEAAQFQAGKLWHRWDYPHAVGSRDFEERSPVFAQYLTDNWRAYRAWGVSAISPWEYEIFWKLRDGVDKRRRPLPVDWDRLQRPGFSPDYVQDQYEVMNLSFESSDWIPTAAAQAILRNNRPLLAYIGGKPAHFTTKDHNFLPGETVEKQLILINNSRETVACDCQWSFALPRPSAGGKKLDVPTGEQVRIPLHFDLPPTLAPGRYEIRATVRFRSGEPQSDSFAVNVLPLPSTTPATARIALYDPRGETGKVLDGLRIRYQPVEATTDLSVYDLLIVGKAALTRDAPAPNVQRVRDGLKVILFEQTADVLEQRLGFRVEEYGLRNVFPRVPDHVLLAGLDADTLRDWRGEATLLPAQLQYTMRPRYGPTVQWCGIDVTRVWRCGCRGNVASVLIEKPARGDFLPILDGGYSLQYSPLMEYREGKGMVLFCQMDVSGRTESDPAADRLARRIVQYASAWKPAPRRKALYVGDPAGKAHLASAGFSLGSYPNESLPPGGALIVGPGGGKELAGREATIGDWQKGGGRLLAVGLDEADASAFLPSRVQMQKREHISAFFDPPNLDSPLTGIGPADVHNRDPRELPLLTGGAALLGDGVLANAPNAGVVFCQLAPWQFDPSKQLNLKRTFRRSSYLLTRLASNMGVESSTPLLARVGTPVDPTKAEKRWLSGLYLDIPEEWDDPYRFFRW